MSLPAPSWSAQPAAAPHRCPFNRQAYVSGLTHLGQADIRPASPAVILRRTIRGNSRVDGLGAWPYVWIDNEADIADLRAAYRDFVTLTLVTQPGYRPAAAERNAVFFKDHYVFDPSREFPQLSKTTRKQVRRATKTYECEIVTDVAQRLEAANLYQALKRRKNIAAGFFDFHRSHFEALARLPEAIFFRVRESERVDAVACAVMFGEWIQLLHIAISDAGLRASASYTLMAHLLDYAKSRDRLLCLGGVSRHGNAGILRFKRRWSNCTVPVFLFAIVNDRAAYAELTAAAAPGTYFPAYREPL